LHCCPASSCWHYRHWWPACASPLRPSESKTELRQDGHSACILPGNRFHDVLEESAGCVLCQGLRVWEREIVKPIFPSPSKPSVRSGEIQPKKIGKPASPLTLVSRAACFPWCRSRRRSSSYRLHPGKAWHLFTPFANRPLKKTEALLEESGHAPIKTARKIPRGCETIRGPFSPKSPARCPRQVPQVHRTYFFAPVRCSELHTKDGSPYNRYAHVRRHKRAERAR